MEFQYSVVNMTILLFVYLSAWTINPEAITHMSQHRSLQEWKESYNSRDSDGDTPSSNTQLPALSLSSVPVVNGEAWNTQSCLNRWSVRVPWVHSHFMAWFHHTANLDECAKIVVVVYQVTPHIHIITPWDTSILINFHPLFYYTRAWLGPKYQIRSCYLRMLAPTALALHHKYIGQGKIPALMTGAHLGFQHLFTLTVNHW